MNQQTEKVTEMQNKLIFKMIGNVRKEGFQDLRMEDIAKIMDVSRATLYKYFSNKEEVFTKFTDGLVEYIEQLSNNHMTIKNWGDNFQAIFEQSVSLALLITDSFLKELRLTYPEMHEKLTTAIAIREKQVIAFYEEGIKKEIFNSLNPQLLLLQNHILYTLFDPKFLINSNRPVEQLLWDYYDIQKVQLIQPSAISQLDDKNMNSKIIYLTNKIKSILFS